MSEVNATGMLNCIPECAVRVYNALRTLLWERATYWRGQILHSFTNKVLAWAAISIICTTRFSQDLRSGQVDVEAHVFYYVIKIFKQKNRLIGFLKAQ